MPPLPRKLFPARLRAIPVGERWLIATVGLLVLLVGQLIAARTAETAYIRSLVSAPPLSALGSDSAATIAVLFRLNDCAGSIEALRHLNAAAGSAQLRVTGLALETTEDSIGLRTILGGTGIHYAVRGSADSGIVRTLRSLGHTSTPVAVVLDRRRHVRLIAPVTEATSRRTIRQILAYAATLGEPIPQPPIAQPLRVRS